MLITVLLYHLLGNKNIIYFARGVLGLLIIYEDCYSVNTNHQIKFLKSKKITSFWKNPCYTMLVKTNGK